MKSQQLKIAICGATGKQGGSVIEALRHNDCIKLIAITRNGKSDQSLELSKHGIDIVEANFDQVESLRKAFHGCDSVFAVTNFWEHLDPKKEYQQACAIFDAAEAESIQHVVWSTLEHTMDKMYQDSIPLIHNYKVAHFDEKGLANKYAATKKFQLTSLYTSFYYENLTGVMHINPDENNTRTLCLPMDDKPLPIVSCRDIGKMAAHCLVNRVYGDVGVASEHLTGHQIADILTKSTGEPFTYQSVPANIYRTFGFPGCEELGNMFEFKNVHNEVFCDKRNLKRVRDRIETTSFSSWCSDHKVELL